MEHPAKSHWYMFDMFWVYLNYSAKCKSKLLKMVAENKLITTGVYGIVRNPVYSAVFLMCTGAICMANNLVLFLIPVICWRKIC